MATHYCDKTRRAAYSLPEVAEMFSKERSWVYRQIKAGRIKAIRGYGAMRISADEVSRILAGEEESK